MNKTQVRWVLAIGVPAAVAIDILIIFAFLHFTAPPGPSVAACTSQIVAHPDIGPWPLCKGLTHRQLVQATANAMAQGAKG
jgi:hypothetical protein